VSERTRLWLLRLLALAIAVVTWFFVAIDEREQLSEKVVEAAITYNTPRGSVLLEPAQTVQVRLRGRTSKIRNLNPFLVDVLVQLPPDRRGAFTVVLGPENVVAPSDVEIVSIAPNQLQLRLDREVTVMVPVRPQLVGEPAAGAVVQGVQVVPDKVMVSGPETRLRGIRSVTTSPVSLNGHALDFEETAAVLAPDPLIKVLEPAVVTVRVPMEPPRGSAAGRDGGRR